MTTKTPEETRQDNDRQILKNLVDNAPTSPETKSPVKEILKCYDYDTDSSEIFAALMKYYKTDLMVAAQYLRKLPETFRYKTDLVKAITKRIDNLLLEECRKCKLWYAIERDEYPVISCSLCGQGCHEACYKDLAPLLEQYPGLKYTCLRCEGLEVEEERKTPAKNPEGPANPSQATAPKSPHRPEPDEEEEEKEKEDDPRPICQRLRRGVCPHGVRGTNPIDGQICQYKHLRRCQPYCKFGTDPIQGCEKGRDCNLLHPVLCKFALQYKSCTNLRCKFTHVKGTRRYKTYNDRNEPENYRAQRHNERNNYEQRTSYFHDRELENNRGRINNERDNDHRRNSHFNEPESSYRRNHNESERQHGHTYRNESVRYNQGEEKYSNRPRSNTQTHEHDPTKNSQTQASFLEEIVKQMKEMQQEMREMRDIYKTPPHLKLPWFVQPMQSPATTPSQQIQQRLPQSTVAQTQILSQPLNQQ